MLEDLDHQEYNDHIAALRETEYPMLGSATYLDHAGTTLYSRSLIDAASAELLSSMVANPHSTSSSSLSTTQNVDDVRVQVLHYFNADPNYFDVVFVANATAAIKLVGEAFRDHPQGFWYGYHMDSHTSLVGVRELSSHGNHCFSSDSEVEQWLDGDDSNDVPQSVPHLFAYPGQSNMNGRRLPLDWAARSKARNTNSYTLLDAAALVATAPFDLSDQDRAPDFTALSFYKIFGYPDLGALIVHKRASGIFHHRLYFGGGTVEAVSCLDQQWHASKESSLHSRLEDGTLPLRNIATLRCAMDTYHRLYGPPHLVANHTTFLARTLFDGLQSLRHGNGARVCTFYHSESATFPDQLHQGPIIALNLRDQHGNYHSCYEVNKLASIKDIHLRTGTLCNPAGVAKALALSSKDLQDTHDAGFRCGTDGDVRDGKPIAMARVSLGACSTLHDVQTFLSFIDEFFVQQSPIEPPSVMLNSPTPKYVVKTITIYPIKSCAGWSVPATWRWQIGQRGLAWDREWCLLHQGTQLPLNQKRCTAMTLMRPSFDLSAHVLRITYAGDTQTHTPSTISVPLGSLDRSTSGEPVMRLLKQGRTGPDVWIYQDPAITKFFSEHLGVPCFLARAASASPASGKRQTHLVSTPQNAIVGNSPDGEAPHLPGSFPTPPPSPPPAQRTLSNESPILTISQASVDNLNHFVARQQNDRDPLDQSLPSEAISPESFRANIVLCAQSNMEAIQPFEEESWSTLRFFQRHNGRFGGRVDGQDHLRTPTAKMEVLGACRRCQMICIDQQNGKRQPGPFTALAKLRHSHGGARFGIHCAPLQVPGNTKNQLSAQIGVGDVAEGVRAAERT